MTPERVQIVDGRRLQIPEHPRFVFQHGEWHFTFRDHDKERTYKVALTWLHQYGYEAWQDCCAVAACWWRGTPEQWKFSRAVAEAWEAEWRRCQK